MNSGTFIILLAATFPTLAILSFIFSLAAYFLPPRAHPETRARVEKLEEFCDVMPAIVGHIKHLEKIVVHERKRTRRLESNLRDMASQMQRNSETADEAGDEAEMHLDSHEEGGRIGSERSTRRDSWTVMSEEEQHTRDLDHRTVFGLRHCRFNQPATKGVPLVNLRGGAGSVLDDGDALEMASTTEMPPSPEYESPSSNDTRGILTQAVNHDGNEETRARMLVDETSIALFTTRGVLAHTTNGFSQPLRQDRIYDHTETPFSILHQPTITINHQPSIWHNPPPAISPSSFPPLLPRQNPTRRVFQNDTEELRRTYILTQILENTRPRIRPRIITTIVEQYARSLADTDREGAASTDANVEETPNTGVNVMHTPSTATSNDYHNDYTLRSTPAATNHVPGQLENSTVDEEISEIVRPLIPLLYAIRPGLSIAVIADVLARYTAALRLDFSNRTHYVTIRSNGVTNGHVYRNEAEDLSADTDQDMTRSPHENYEARLSEPRRNGEDTENFIINDNINSTHDGPAEHVTAYAEDVRPRPRLSMPELNDAIEHWGSVVNTPEGLVLRLRGEGEGYEFYLRRSTDSPQNGENRANGHGAATQVIDASECLALESTTPESSTWSSRSASLNGTTLVNSVASLSLDDDTGIAAVPESNVDGAPSENIEIYRNNAYETSTASLRRRRAVSDIRRTMRQNALSERGNASNDEEIRSVDVAEAEDARWSLRHRRRDSIEEEEMMQHALGRERAVQVEQTNRVGMNGDESEESEESSNGSVGEARGRRPVSR